MQEAFRIVSLCCETSRKLVANAKLHSFTTVKLTVETGFLVETLVTMVNLQGRVQTHCCVLVKLHRV